MTGRPPRPNVDGVRTGARLRESPSAVCSACSWARYASKGSDWLATRAAARRHTRTTGHETVATISYVHVYLADPPAWAEP